MDELVVDGIRYKSIREACIKNGANYSKVLRRVNNGMTLETAIKYASRANFGRNSIEVEGNTFDSLKDACENYNVNYYTIVNKIRYGMSVEGAIKFTRPIKKREPIEIDGVLYSTIRDVCAVYDAHYPTVITRMRNGKTIEEAVKDKSDGRAKRVVIGDKEFVSVAEACRSYGVDYNYVRYQVRKGLDLEEAIKVVKARNSLFKI